MSGLRAVLLDESGAPAAGELAGKVTLSWRSGSKKTTWGAAAATATPGIKLPAAKARRTGRRAGSGLDGCSQVRELICLLRGPHTKPTLQCLSSCPLQAPESVATVGSEWVRFTATDPPLVLEAALQVQAVPAAPATWTLSLVDQVWVGTGWVGGWAVVCISCAQASGQSYN